MNPWVAVGCPLLVAIAGLALGFVGIVSPTLFGVIFVLGAVFVLVVIVVELYDAFRRRR
jgi:hypothetical protein